MSLTLPYMLGTRLYKAVLTYLLKTNFAGATPATLTNGQVLDTAAEGLATGSLTVVDTGTGVVQLADSVLKATGTNPAAWDATGHGSTTAIARAEGRIYKAKLSLTGTGLDDSAILGLHGTSGSLALATRKHTFVFGGSLALYCTVGNGAPNYSQGAYTVATEYQIAIVLRSAGAFYFIKGGVYSTWTLLVVDTSESTATLYTAAQCRVSTRILSILEEKVTETLYPDLVQTIAEDDFSEANGTALEGKSLDKGTSWVLVLSVGAGTPPTVESGKGTYTSSNASTTYRFFAANCNASDVLITNNYKAGQGGHAIVARCSVGDNLQESVQLFNDELNHLQIYEGHLGGSAQRASVSATLTNGVEYAYSLRVVGANVVGAAGGVTVNATLATPQTLLNHGFGLNDRSAEASPTIDNFKVYPITGYDTILDAI